MQEQEPPMMEGGKPERQEPIEQSQLPDNGAEEHSLPETPIQQQKPNIKTPKPTAKQIQYAKVMSKLYPAGIPPKTTTEIKLSTVTPAQEGKLVTNIRYYPIKVPMADTTPNQLIEKPIRILNPGYIELISDKAILEHPGFKKNIIQISATGKIKFNYREIELHKYTIAALNIAMATCAHPALTLDKAFGKIDLGDTDNENNRRKEKLHFALVRLLDTGIIYYNPHNRNAIRLLPTVIQDSRIFSYLK